jgi:hypothetical protein
MQQLAQTELCIESPNKETSSLTISGISEDFSKSPEKVHQLLDLLDMPKGTQVTISTKASTSIVR